MKSWRKRSEIRIYSKLRLVICLLILVLAMLLLVFTPLFNRGQAMEPSNFIIYFVAEGDTLWEIAKQTLPDNTDIRDYIGDIRQANDMSSANIKVGQKLVIPIR